MRHLLVIRDHPHAAANQRILHGDDPALVPRDHPAAVDHGIPLTQSDVRMRVRRNPRHGTPRLPLATGHQHQQVLVRHAAGILLRKELRPPPSDTRNPAPPRPGSANSGPPARHVRPAAFAAFATLCTRATLDAKHVTAIRPCLMPLMIRVRLSKTSASLPECPSTMAFVLSHTIASTPSSPSASNAATSVGGPTSGSAIQLPVARMQHRPERRPQHQRLRSPAPNAPPA